ncbi:MAG TPA: amino acid adenylation domain-containing protein [Pseudolabrys sp.]|nr:amino acid adenylation domain-containing protein [Pseudolabrys sp.]
MTESLLSILTSQGVELWFEGDRLRFRAPKGVLSDEQRAQLATQRDVILAELRARAAGSSKLVPPSYSQQSLWFLHRQMPESAAYHVAMPLRILSTIDISNFNHALQSLVDRHGILRTTYELKDGVLMQRIAGAATVALNEYDVAGLSDDEIYRRVRADYERPFDLAHGPVFRASLYTRDSSDHVLLLTVHHIAADGWSLVLLIEDMFRIYDEAAGGKPAKLPRATLEYADYVAWQRDYLDGADGERLWSYWRGKLAPPRSRIEIPADRPRSEHGVAAGASLPIRIDADATAQIKELARQQATTPFVVLLATFKVFLLHMTGIQDVIVGTPTFGRSKPDFIRVVGDFVNTVPLRSQLRFTATFLDLVTALRQTVLEALDGQEFPLPLMVERLHPTRAGNRTPLFDTFFILQRFDQFRDIEGLLSGDETQAAVEIGGLRLAPYAFSQQDGQFDLAVQFIERGGTFLGAFKYRSDLFESETVRDFAADYLMLVRSLLADPSAPLHQALRAEAVVTGGAAPAGNPERKGGEAVAKTAHPSPKADDSADEAEQAEMKREDEALMLSPSSRRGDKHSARKSNIHGYWKARLAGAPEALELPREHQRPAVLSNRLAVESRSLSPGLSERIRRIVGADAQSVFTGFLAAFQVLLYRYTGQTDLVIGASVPGATHAGQADARRPAEILPLRVDLSENPGFMTVLERAREAVFGALVHQDISLETLIEDFAGEPDASRAPLVQVTFAFENKTATLPGLNRQSTARPNGRPSFDLSFRIVEHESRLKAEAEYSPDLFGPEMISSLLDHFSILLNAIVGHPQQPINELPLLAEPERQMLLREFNRTERDYPHDARVERLFEEQARRTPEKTALVFGGQEMSYQELERRAARLARHLQSRGLGPGATAALYVQRSFDMIVGLLAILKAGGAYIPLDPIYPADRISLMLDDAQPRILLTQTALRKQVPNIGAEIVCLDDLPDETAAHALESDSRSADDVAYVIYTSGSTGKPKGVQLTHRNVVNFLVAMQNEPGLTPDDIVLAVTTVSFDIAVLEIFLPLICGARVVIAAADTAADGIALAKMLDHYGVTLMQATPATWRLLLDAGWSGNPHLKILCGGEAWPRELAGELLARCGSLWNMYGPTETTVWSAVARVHSGEAVHVGPPVANTQLYVLQDGLQLAPLWAPGELYIGGDGVAKGYLNRIELTAERFIPDPFMTGGRLYRTGDLVRRLPNGYVEFLGRTDHQVKIRGFRIELDEIANVLRKHPHIADAVLCVQERGGDKQLVAFVTARARPVDIADIKAFLSQRLPAYMVPSGIIVLDAFPLTPNGKIDRKALMATDWQTASSGEEHEPPGTTTEIGLAQIWQDILKVDKISRHDDFFALGGHSLMITRLIYEINKTYNVSLGIPELFRHPTVQKLAAVIDRQAPEAKRLPAVVSLKEGGTELPVYFIYAGPDEFRLAQLMGERHPVFGIEAPWPLSWRAAVAANRTAAFPTMDELVASFVDALKAHTGQSPCLLAGHSFAGLIAFEAAHQFQKQGGKVELVVVVDKWARNPALREVVWMNLKECWAPAGGKRPSLMARFRTTCFVAWWYLKQEKNRLRLRLNLPLADPRQMTAMLDEKGIPLHWGLLERLYARLERTYRPRRLDSRGVVFRTEFLDDNQSVRTPDSSLGWSDLFTQGVEVIPVIGDHLSLIREHNESLGRKMSDALQRHGTGVAAGRPSTDG